MSTVSALVGKGLADRVRDRRAPVVFTLVAAAYALILFFLHWNNRPDHALVAEAVSLLAAASAVAVAFLGSVAVAGARQQRILALVYGAPASRGAVVTAGLVQVLVLQLLLVGTVVLFAGAAAVLSGTEVFRRVGLYILLGLLAFQVFLTGLVVLASAVARTPGRAAAGAAAVLLALTAIIPSGPAGRVLGAGALDLLALNPVHGAVAAAGGEAAVGAAVAALLLGIVCAAAAYVRVHREEVIA